MMDQLVPLDCRDFNLERFDGSTCQASDIINAMQGLPFMGERRVVVVNHAEEISAADSRIVGEMLSQIPKSTCLLFLYEGKANLREEIPAQVASHGGIVTFWTPFPNQLPAWVVGEARQRGKSMGYEAAQLLGEACQDLQEISNEMDKLCLFIGNKKNIEVADIRAHGLPDEVGDTRLLEDALWERNSAQALSHGRRLAEVGVRGEMIFPLCERVFRTLLLAQTLQSQKKMSVDDICGALNIRSKMHQTNLLKGLKAYRAAEIQGSLEKVLLADQDLKTGHLPSEVAVSLLLWNLCGAGQNQKTLQRSNF